MTDEEIIKAAEEYWGSSERIATPLTFGDMKRLIELARLGLTRKPPEGSIPVRIPVAYNAAGNMAWKGYKRGTGVRFSDVTAWFREIFGSLPEKTAIVTAMLPPVVKPEVEGSVEKQT
jgi:hypothetical protein